LRQQLKRKTSLLAANFVISSNRITQVGHFLKNAAGAAALALANMPQSTAESESSRRNGLPARIDSNSGRSTKHEARSRKAKARHKRWQQQYKNQKKQHPGMPDTWHAQKNSINRDHAIMRCIRPGPILKSSG
jgi:hypothetical protein